MSGGVRGVARTVRGEAIQFHKLQPDVLVAREADLTEKLLPVAPVLAVEVKGDEVFEAERPYPVRIVPVELMGTLAHGS